MRKIKKVKLRPIGIFFSLLMLAGVLFVFQQRSSQAGQVETLWANSAAETTKSRRAENAKTAYLNFEGIKYAYRVFGKSSDVPVLLLQRFRATMDDWDPAFLNAIAKERQVIVFNNAGVATSTGEVPTTIKGAADHAAKLARGLGYAQVDIIGWSMAGFTAQVMAIEYPDLVRKVILIGTGPGGSPETSPPALDGVFDIATRPTYQQLEHELLFFTDSPEGKAAAEASLNRINRARGGELEAPTTSTVMERQAKAITAFWFEGDGGYFSKLKNLTQPTLIINGDRDAFFDVKGQWLLYREIPNARLSIYPMAGHGAHHQFPKHVGSSILHFLSVG
ncbi:MAG: alpha/beta hydrolase [Saprospiraceae bacterium]|nr:alpha/beta hydrolase [Saprospiraceae bacterium]